MENRKIRVGITQGDINGVGYEVILKVFQEGGMLDLCTPIIYGSPKIASFHRKALDLNTNFLTIDQAEDAVDGKVNLVACIEEEVKIDLGKPTKESGQAALMALERSIIDYRSGLIDVLVTAPINKYTIQSQEFQFPGHTEYIQACVGEGQEALMVLMNRTLRVALVTTHLPIRKIADAITQDAIVQKLRIFNKALKRDLGIESPRIAVLGLNPHAGDQGLLGEEEQNIIKPALEQAMGEGIFCFGPFAADGFFGSRAYEAYDGVLAMYHDQGLAPFKALAMNDGINYTAGLPIVRTSPDHGTAYDIAGKGLADPTSLREAIYTAIDVYRNRMRYDEAYAHPLRKMYYEKRDDSDTLKLNAPEEEEA